MKYSFQNSHSIRNEEFPGKGEITISDDTGVSNVTISQMSDGTLSVFLQGRKLNITHVHPDKLIVNF